jgi:hypothetical protein
LLDGLKKNMSDHFSSITHAVAAQGRRFDEIVNGLEKSLKDIMSKIPEGGGLPPPENKTDERPKYLPPRTPRTGAIVGKPYVCSTLEGKYTLHDRFCYCNGDIYYGKKYVSGNSGATLSFEDMTKGGCKDYTENSHQKEGCKVKRYEKLRNSGAYGPRKGIIPGWKYEHCGGCISWHDRGFCSGYAKQCYCVPKEMDPPPPPTPAPTGPTPPPTWAPAPPPNATAPPWSM